MAARLEVLGAVTLAMLLSVRPLGVRTQTASGAVVLLVLTVLNRLEKRAARHASLPDDRG